VTALSATPDVDAGALRPPASAAQMFRVFNRLALQGFGGVLAVAQRELVERERWLTREQFLEALSLGQILPGPNVINMALMIGDRFFGWRGAAASVAGLVAAPLLIVVVLAALYAHYLSHPAVAGALRGMGAVAAGLVIATALKMVRPLARNPLGRGTALLFVAATTLAIGVLRWPMVAVVLGFGSVAVALAWAKLGR
jgi:chromate transporter